MNDDKTETKNSHGPLAHLARTMGGCLVVLIAIPLLVLLALVIIIKWPRPAADETCFESKTILAQFGDTVFAVPREYKPFIQGDDLPRPNGAVGDQVVCYRVGDPAIKAAELTIDLGRVARDWDREHYELAKRAEGFQFTIIARGDLRARLADRFIETKRLLDKLDIGLYDLPLEGEFRVLRHPIPERIARERKDSTPVRDFISDGGIAKTPTGYPLSINCGSGPPILSPTGDIEFGQVCSTSYALSPEGPVIQYRFYSLKPPIEKWIDADAALRALLGEWDVSGQMSTTDDNE